MKKVTGEESAEPLPSDDGEGKSGGLRLKRPRPLPSRHSLDSFMGITRG